MHIRETVTPLATDMLPLSVTSPPPSRESELIDASMFFHLITELGQQGLEDIEWSENLHEPLTPLDFAEEAIFVICNSGMKNTIARKIYKRVIEALESGRSASMVFGHRGKANAIDHIWRGRAQLFNEFRAATDKLAFLETLPWIGKITKYHLAKNFGVDVAKPDVHLQRLADIEGTTAQALCERLAAETGYRIATIDTILWRACANGVMNSRTGKLI